MKTDKLDPATDAQLSALTRDSDFGWKVNFNNTPLPDSGIVPGTPTLTFRIGAKWMTITEEQFSELQRRLGFRDEQNAFLARNFPDKFGTAKA